MIIFFYFFLYLSQNKYLVQKAYSSESDIYIKDKHRTVRASFQAHGSTLLIYKYTPILPPPYYIGSTIR